MKALKNRKSESFEANSIMLFALMMIANICNYLFQIIIGHMVQIEQYAQINAIVSLVGILSIPTTIITMISARYIALNSAGNNDESVNEIIKVMLKFAIIIGIVIACIILLFLNNISTLFKLDSKHYVLGTLIITIVNLCFSITAGTLQGMKSFFQYGMQTILVAAGKLFFSVFLIWAGWKVYGVIFAILIGTGIATCYGVYYVKKTVSEEKESSEKSSVDIREFMRYSIGTIVAQGCVIALTNGDVLLVKAYFTDTEAGLYSSAAVIGKIAMYVSTAIVATLFPLVVEKYQKGESTQGLLKKAMLYGGGVAIFCAIGMITLGRFVIGVLFGERYLQAIEMLPPVCIYVVALTFITILMNYLLAIDKIKMFGSVMVIAVALIVGCSELFHESVMQVMIMAGSMLFVAFGVNVVYLVYIKRKSTLKEKRE